VRHIPSVLTLDCTRVTRFVCEKITQSVALPVFCQNYYTTFTVLMSSLKTWVTYFFNLQIPTLPNVNNHPRGEISPNLVTLDCTHMVTRWDCEKVAQNADQTIFCQNYVIHKFYRGKVSPKFCTTSLIFKTLPKVNVQPLDRRKLTQ
jgi:hypothetical protein